MSVLAPAVPDSARALLRAVVDYAGLFPPASATMGDAVAHDASERAGADQWMLGRFVLPAARLAEFTAVHAPFAGEPAWGLSAVVGDLDAEQPLPYLDTAANRTSGTFDITLEATLSTARMRETGHAPMRLAHAHAADLYWTLGQVVAHHTMNGCNLRPGDPLASGTVSGPAPDSLGCLLELTRRGAQPLALPGGETRAFLEDGDEIALTAFCAREGAARIGFGECRGRIVDSAARQTASD